jgi:hypothetical protein
MVKIVYRVLAKEGQDFKSLAENILLPEARKMASCRFISLFQNTENSREFIFYERWESEAAVHEYKERLIGLLGAARPGEEFPQAMNDMIEADEDMV